MVFQKIRIGLEAGRKRAMEICAVLQTMNCLTREDRRARGGAGRRRRKRVGEQDPLPCQSIEVRRLDGAVPVDSRVGPRPVIGKKKEDVGARILLGNEPDQQERDEKEYFHERSILRTQEKWIL